MIVTSAAIVILVDGEGKIAMRRRDDKPGLFGRNSAGIGRGRGDHERRPGGPAADRMGPCRADRNPEGRRMEKRYGSVIGRAALGVAFAILARGAAAVKVELPVIADTLLAGHSSEKDLNCGGRELLRVKGYQGIVVFRFDMSKVEEHKSSGGTLSVFTAGISGDAAGKTNSEVISTISHDWVEGVGDYDFDEESATFIWPGEPIAETWGDDNEELSDRYGPTDALDVTGGFGGSIVNGEGFWEFTVDEWTDIELDAELVQGLMDGEQYGIAVMRNSVGVNLDLSSREAGGGVNAPRLVVESSGLAVEARDKAASVWGDIKDAR